MQCVSCQGVAPQSRYQRCQKPARLTDPAGEGGARQFNAFPGVDTALELKRNMVTVCGDQDVGQQARTGRSSRNRAFRCLGLYQRLAAGTGQLRAHMAFDPETLRHVFEHLGDILANPPQFTTTIRAAMFSGIMYFNISWQVVGE